MIILTLTEKLTQLKDFIIGLNNQKNLQKKIQLKT